MLGGVIAAGQGTRTSRLVLSQMSDAALAYEDHRMTWALQARYSAWTHLHVLRQS